MHLIHVHNAVDRAEQVLNADTMKMWSTKILHHMLDITYGKFYLSFVFC